MSRPRCRICDLEIRSPGWETTCPRCGASMCVICARAGDHRCLSSARMLSIGLLILTLAVLVAVALAMALGRGS